MQAESLTFFFLKPGAVRAWSCLTLGFSHSGPSRLCAQLGPSSAFWSERASPLHCPVMPEPGAGGMGQSALLCAELTLGALAVVWCRGPVSGMFSSSFLPHVRFLFLFKVDRVGPGKWSVGLGLTVQNSGRKTRDSFVFSGPKSSFPPGAPCLQRGPRVCLAELACRTFGA